MARGALSVLGDRVAAGVVVGEPFEAPGAAAIRFLPAAHPLPDQRSVAAARAVLELAQGAGADDLFIALVSGGGSAQAALPVPGVTLEDKRALTDGLLRAGAAIRELNAVRRGLSAFKGGKLAGAASPASVLGLVLSDVVGNDLSVIASGPTVPEGGAPGEAKAVLVRYGLWEDAPDPVRRSLGGVEIAGGTAAGGVVVDRVRNIIVGDNRVALAAAKTTAEKLGFRAFILTDSDHGEAREAARRYAALLEIISVQTAARRPVCLLAGGELTVTVRGPGRGGRNQEFALASLVEMGRRFRGRGDWLIASLGTDGIDGTTEAAGALASPAVAERAMSLGLDASLFLEANDSYGFFERAGGLVVTGPTRTNVMDLRILLYAPPPTKAKLGGGREEPRAER
jgi:glycerate-2-kinase